MISETCNGITWDIKSIPGRGELFNLAESCYGKNITPTVVKAALEDARDDKQSPFPSVRNEKEGDAHIYMCVCVRTRERKV